ncbi:dihydrofolate reductase family protein [Chitinophaga alhagiae]|uniref:dihydrofolate reductase family protein n=1 Tax=Chitinophaga alhagiae TaxID=2203219 RepID=UPI000E5AA093|nr:dihydrofolate reductase family protein [Chitinophaga alhagiae]
MRNLIFGINITLDGCCDHTKGYPNEELHEYFTDIMQEADLVVYGRKTYELMVPFWPNVARNKSGGTKAMNDFAQKFDVINKLVFSRSLSSVEDKNTRIASTGLREEILKLKQEEGKKIMTGGVDLPSQLIELGLVDEYVFVIHPLVAGEGRRLPDTGKLQQQLRLSLVESKVFESGHVALRYLKE